MKVLFVCTGNTCRSPMAQAILQRKAKEDRLDITADSAAIMMTYGERVKRIFSHFSARYAPPYRRERSHRHDDLAAARRACHGGRRRKAGRFLRGRALRGHYRSLRRERGSLRQVRRHAGKSRRISDLLSQRQIFTREIRRKGKNFSKLLPYEGKKVS